MRYILASLPLVTLAPLALGQGFDSDMTTNVFRPPPPSALSWQAGARDGMSTTWQATEQVIDPVTGAITNLTHQYVEIASGLNYLPAPATGEWVASQDLIELMPDGSAAALRGPAKLYLKANLNSPGAATIVTVSNRVFQTRPIGLFWYDPASGNASLIAQLQDCVGELEPPNEVVYRGAFGAVADVRLTYTKGAIESDLVLLQSPQLPAGFDPATARLELWHEWQPMPAPMAQEHLVGAQGETDQVLDFGDLWFPTGAAYWSDGSDARAADTPAVVRVPTLTRDGALAPVCKTWLPGATQDVLVEAVTWNEVASKLASLPPASPGALPSPMLDRSSWLTQLAVTAASSSASPAVISQGQGYQAIGLVWDYINVPSSCTTNYPFNTGQTYYVSSGTYFGATVTFNPCVIKFNGGCLLIYGSISCNGSLANPTILTSWQDDLFGLQIQPSSPCPTYSAAIALEDYYINANVWINGMRFRWADTGLQLLANGCGTYTHTVAGCSFELCQVGIYANNCNVTIYNSTRCGVGTPTSAGTPQCTYFSGSLTDICSGDSDHNGAPDLTEYQYFGRLGTLPGNVLGGVTARTAGLNPAGAEPIWWTLNDTNGPAGAYTYNTACWLCGVAGLSAFSPWNAYGVRQGGGTLITPRHAVTIWHMGYDFPANMPMRFVGTDNVSHQVTYLRGEMLADVDIWVMVFDQDLPSNVGYVRVLPDAVRHKLTPTMEEYRDPCYSSQNVPAVAFNQNKDAFIYDLYSLEAGDNAFFHHSQLFPNWGSECYRGGYCCHCPGYDLMCGDSGSPAFLVIDGELALIGPWDDCGLAAWTGQYFDELNTAIADLDTWVSNNFHTNAMTGYTAAPYPVDSFPDLW